MQNVSVLKITGLSTNDNELSEVPQGSLEDCNNVVLTKDSILEPRRGFKVYGNAMGLSATNDVAKQLLTYKKRILRHFSSTLEFDNGSGTFTAFAGTYNEVRPGTRIKSLESNGNLYFTTNEGIKKISASSASNLGNTPVTKAGMIRALDLNGQLNDTEGFFLQNSKVAYRIVWGIKDSNSNVLTGAPSERLVLTNDELLLLIKDFNNLLVNLDIASNDNPSDEISDGNYVTTYKIPANSGSSALTLHTNLIGLASKLENDINLIADTTFTRTVTKAEITASLGRVVLSSAVPSWLTVGQTVKFENFPAPYTAINGTFTIASFATDTVANDTIEFALTATVQALAATTGKVIKNEFESITQPATPSVPPLVTEIDALQTYYIEIVNTLLAEPTSKINDASIFANNTATTSSTVKLQFTIPDEITTSHFYQVYRTLVSQATGAVTLDDIEPGDEMGLVYEANPTSAQISAKEVELIDVTPETFRGQNLYTNPQSGEGILQANEEPPLALDICAFRNSTFFANTKTKYKLLFNLLGIGDFTSEVSNLIITDGDSRSTYTFVSPQTEITKFTSVADVAGSLAGLYFYINSAKNQNKYTVWFKVSGVGTDPNITGRTSIEVDFNNNDTANDVAAAIRAKLNEYNDFTITGINDEIIIETVDKGIVDDATVETSTFSVTITQQGKGEDVAQNYVLLSDAATPAQQVDETARSLVRIINKNNNSIVYASYTSGPDDVPGQMLLYSKTLANSKFYVYTLDSNIVSSFNPTLSVGYNISDISVSNPTVITTSANHNLSTGDEIVISDTDSVPAVDGIYTVTVLSATTFSIPIEVVTQGTTGLLSKTTVAGDNEEYGNRLYFSKVQQPDAVPIVNFLDIGPRDSEITRILALRDGLFVFKEEGIYRISGESALTGFNAVLFDNTTKLIASDSAVASNNQIFYFGDQGIVTVTDTSSNIISKDIENKILPLVLGTNFSSATFGVGYESDRAYTIFTISDLNDEHATVAYRYNFINPSWTKWEISKTCGIVNEDKMHLGASDINYIEQERKNFERQDYADREYTKSLNTGGVSGLNITLGDVTNINVGDVLFQEQYLTIYKYNQLLSKLDIDNGVADSDYYSLLNAVSGDNLRNKLDSLATKLDNDAGVSDTDYLSSISSYTSSFVDTQLAYNVIVNKLNNDVNIIFNNYSLSSNTVEYEAIIESIDSLTNTVTINIPLPLILGNVVIYNSYDVNAKWNIQHFGDPEVTKQVPESKIIFKRTNFTKMNVSFQSDISNSIDTIDATLYGNGTFGNDELGTTVFGGEGDRRPQRVYVPRSKQRCRFIQMKIAHKVAREKMSVLGYSMVFKAYSQRSYRK